MSFICTRIVLCIQNVYYINCILCANRKLVRTDCSYRRIAAHAIIVFSDNCIIHMYTTPYRYILSCAIRSSRSRRFPGSPLLFLLIRMKMLITQLPFVYRFICSHTNATQLQQYNIISVSSYRFVIFRIGYCNRKRIFKRLMYKCMRKTMIY